MHQIALLRSEKQLLRQENETLNRRRAKKRTLQKGGSLNLDQGQDLKGQNQVKVQLEGESRRSSSLKRRLETKERRCSIRGKTGHNTRRHQIEVTVSREQNSN